MLTDMTRCHRVETIDYELGFFPETWDCGFAFPCDKNGIVNVKSLEPEARANYEYCVSNPQDFKYFAKVQTIHRHYIENATGVCSCGNRIELWDEYMRACECPHCGKWYNLFGQELNHPDTWKDGDDW